MKKIISSLVVFGLCVSSAYAAGPGKGKKRKLESIDHQFEKLKFQAQTKELTKARQLILGHTQKVTVESAHTSFGLPAIESNYLAFVKSAGRVMQTDGRGKIENQYPSGKTLTSQDNPQLWMMSGANQKNSAYWFEFKLDLKAKEMVEASKLTPKEELAYQIRAQYAHSMSIIAQANRVVEALKSGKVQADSDFSIQNLAIVLEAAQLSQNRAIELMKSNGGYSDADVQVLYDTQAVIENAVMRVGTVRSLFVSDIQSLLSGLPAANNVAIEKIAKRVFNILQNARRSSKKITPSLTQLKYRIFC